MISVIMAAYNSGKYLKTSIDSVIKQSMDDWELLIVNDGSTDYTENVVESYKDSRIRYFYQENKGVGAARNVGLRQMTGDFYCFLDADDALAPESLEVRYQKFLREPETEFIDGPVEIYDKELMELTGRWNPSFTGNPLNELLKISGSCFFSPTWMIRQRKNRQRFFREDLFHGEDLLFFIELAGSGGRYEFVEDVIYKYRKGHSSAMKNLKGLEKGYHHIFDVLRTSSDIPDTLKKHFRRKARSIIFRSYLGNFQIVDALLSVQKKW